MGFNRRYKIMGLNELTIALKSNSMPNNLVCGTGLAAYSSHSMN